MSTPINIRTAPYAAIARIVELLHPPRVMSIRGGEPGYRADWYTLSKRFDVLLDGVPVTRVVAYDCDAGWVRRLQTDANGKLAVRNAAGKLCVQEATLTGTVKAVWRDID